MQIGYKSSEASLNIHNDISIMALNSGSDSNAKGQNTAGPQTSTTGGSTLELTYMHFNAYTVDGNRRNGATDTLVYTSNNIRAHLGAELFYLYQSYAIKRMEIWVTGTESDADTQYKRQIGMWIMPWTMPLANGGTPYGFTPAYMPGAKWTIMSLPQYGTTDGHNDSGMNAPSDRNMLNCTCSEPKYEVQTFTETNPGGIKLMTGHLPTVAKGALDTTQWNGFLFQYERNLGPAVVFDWYYGLMWRITVEFKGIRLQQPFHSLSDPDYSEHDKPTRLSGPNRTARPNYGSEQTRKMLRSRSNYVGSDAEDGRSSEAIHTVQRKPKKCKEQCCRATRKERRRRATLACIHPVRQPEETTVGWNICPGAEEYVDQAIRSEQRPEPNSSEKIVHPILLQRGVAGVFEKPEDICNQKEPIQQERLC